MYLKFLLFLIFTSVIQNAEVYYVNSKDGNDNNSGLSPNLAWKTIAKVNNSKFNPGDEILFKRNSIWREELVISSNGELNKAIKYSAYGEGKNPKILGSNQLLEFIKFRENIWLAKPGKKMGWLWFINKSDSIIWGTKKPNVKELLNKYDFYLENGYIYIFCKVNPLNEFKSIEISVRDFGIISGWKDRSKNFIVIKNFEIMFTKIANIRSVKSNNWIIKNNILHHSGITDESDGQGIQIEGSNNLISQNITFENGQHGIFVSSFGNADVINNIIEKNEVYNNYHTGIDVMNLGGEKLGLRNIIIRNNKVYDTPNHLGKEIGIQLLAYEPGKIVNAKIYYNIIHNVKGIAIAIFPGVDSVLVANNTAYEPESACFLIDGDVGKIICKNNIGVGNNYFTVLSINSIKNKIIENNLWYRKEGILVSTPNEAFSKFDEYVSSTGFDKYSFNLNPEFVDAKKNNFSLKKDSKCIDNGADVELKYDYFRNEIINKPDIGAVEYIK